MENLIASYLFQYQHCPLPGIGTLLLSEKESSVDHSEKTLNPPQAYIHLKDGETETKSFEQYISSVKNIPPEAADSLLMQYSERLQNLDAFAEMKVPCVGKFFVDADGQIVFKQIAFPAHLRQPVHAEKIIHPDATHNLLVGDKESNSAIMTEYYSALPPERRRGWWLAALLLALVGLAMIAFYYFGEHHTGFYNTTPPVFKDGTKTYTTPD